MNPSRPTGNCPSAPDVQSTPAYLLLKEKTKLSYAEWIERRQMQPRFYGFRMKE